MFENNSIITTPTLNNMEEVNAMYLYSFIEKKKRKKSISILIFSIPILILALIYFNLSLIGFCLQPEANIVNANLAIGFLVVPVCITLLAILDITMSYKRECNVIRDKRAILKNVNIESSENNTLVISDNGTIYSIKINEMLTEVFTEKREVTALKVQCSNDKVRYYIVQE